MKKLNSDDLIWFIDNFALEYIHSCILIENLICDDYHEYYNPFIEKFDEFMGERKNFDASSKLNEVYSQLNNYMISCLNIPRENVSEVIGKTPTTSEGFMEAIINLRLLEEGDAS